MLLSNVHLSYFNKTESHHGKWWANLTIGIALCVGQKMYALHISIVLYTNKNAFLKKSWDPLNKCKIPTDLNEARILSHMFLSIFSEH